jgi:hypothetical protein
MGLLIDRHDQIDRIEGRIDGLAARAAKLLEREQELTVTIGELHALAEQPAGRLRTRRRARRLARRRHPGPREARRPVARSAADSQFSGS